MDATTWSPLERLIAYRINWLWSGGPRARAPTEDRVLLSQPDLEKIANDILSSQQREIDQMLDWREQWFGSRTLGPVLPEVLGLPEGELGMWSTAVPTKSPMP